MTELETESATEESTLGELISRFPLAVALLTDDGRISHANELFQNASSSPEAWAALRPLCSAPDGRWHSIQLTRRDGRTLEVRAQSVRIRRSILVVAVHSGEDADSTSLEALRARIAELERRSATDPLTEVWNRRHLDIVIENEISRSLRFRQPVSLVLLDVDQFKLVNDRFGHLAGDQVLRQLVAVLREAIRAGDLLFRWGGDEFVVLAVSSGRRSAAVLGEKLRELVMGEDFGEFGPITVSVGVAEHDEGESTTDWFGRVDAALYAAKTAGRDRVFVDPRGSSDQWARGEARSPLRLEWSESYECGEPTIDAQHRELFVLANSLLAAALPSDGEMFALPIAMDRVIAHVAKHFHDEELVLASRHYAQLNAHREVHRALLARAGTLRSGVHAGAVRPGELIEFLAGDVISRHILKADCAFFPLFSGADPRRPS